MKLRDALFINKNTYNLDKRDFSKLEILENIFKQYIKIDSTLENNLGYMYYKDSKLTISMRPKEFFKNKSFYYHVLSHELAHAMGVYDRTILDHDKFHEEIIAELTARKLSEHFKLSKENLTFSDYYIKREKRMSKTKINIDYCETLSNIRKKYLLEILEGKNYGLYDTFL